jgi:very-short-patch-repair endonuclease
MPASKRFCSHHCFATAPKPKRKNGKQRSCEICGAVVYIPACRLKRTRHFFCSPAHANEYQGRNKTEHICKICRKGFKWSPSREKVANIKYCSIACRDDDPDTRLMLIRLNAKQHSLCPNKLEKLGYALLDALGVTYQKQELINGKICVDAVIPARNIIIQFDGDYWHGNPAKYPTLDARQRKRRSFDKSQDAYLRKCGYVVARFWESELKKNPLHFRDSLLPLLTQP